MSWFKKDKLTYALFQRFSPRFSVFGPNQLAAIENGFKKNSNVYSCISFISGKAGRVNFKITKNGKTIENELSKILTPDLLEQGLGYLKTTGNLYLYAPKLEVGNNKGKLEPNGVVSVMPSHLVKILADKENKIAGYKINETVFNPENVLHIKYFNPEADGLSFYGFSPIAGGRYVISRDTKNMEASSKAYDNMGAAGLLTGNGSIEDQQLTAEQAKEIEEKLKKKYNGVDNFGKFIVTNANMKWQQLGLSPADLKLIEDRKMGIREICNVFHLNSALFNDPANKSYNNMGEARIAAWTDAIIPDIEKITEGITKWLLPAYGDGLELRADYSNIEELQKNKAELVAWLKDAYWIKTNRKQEIMGEEPDSEMDMYLIPSNLMPLDFADQKSIDKFYSLKKMKDEF